MTTRNERIRPQRDRTGDVQKSWKGQTPPSHFPIRGLTSGLLLGAPEGLMDLARRTESALHAGLSRAEAELSRIGRFFNADGFYIDGKIVGKTGDVIVPPSTGGVATILDKDTTQTEIVNSSSLTTIYDGTIPANTMGVDGLVELIMYSDYLNNSGAGRGLQFQVILNGTTYYDYSTPSTFYGSQAARRVNAMCVSFMNLGARNSNLLRFCFNQSLTASNTQGTVTTGIGGVYNTVYAEWLGGSLPITEDTSADTNIVVKMAHSAAHASLSFRQQYSVLRRSA